MAYYITYIDYVVYANSEILKNYFGSSHVQNIQIPIWGFLIFSNITWNTHRNIYLLSIIIALFVFKLFLSFGVYYQVNEFLGPKGILIVLRLILATKRFWHHNKDIRFGSEASLIGKAILVDGRAPQPKPSCGE